MEVVALFEAAAGLGMFLEVGTGVVVGWVDVVEPSLLGEETALLVVAVQSMPMHRLAGERVETVRVEMVDLFILIGEDGEVFVETLEDFFVFVDFLTSFSNFIFSPFRLLTSVLYFLTLFARLSHFWSSLYNSLSFSLRPLFDWLRSAFTLANSSLRFFTVVLNVATSCFFS